MPASSCASEPVVSTSGTFWTARCVGLTEEHIDTPVTLAQNPEEAKELSRKKDLGEKEKKEKHVLVFACPHSVTQTSFYCDPILTFYT